MMVVVHHHDNTVPRRTIAPLSATRRTPPPGPPCDVCRQPTSRYNRYGRCYVCCEQVGYPELRMRRPPSGPDSYEITPHAAGCECYERRYPRPDEMGGPRWRGGRRVYAIDVTCPDCGRVQAVRYDLRGKRWCRVGYQLRCRLCARKEREA